MSLRQELREKIDIVQLISQYVDLKRAGRNFKGLCPFHKEKTPSFFVSPEKGIFHCFGCGKGGDVVTFYMEYHGLEFMDAVRELAERFGIDISLSRGSDSSRGLRNRLYGVCEDAVSLYRGILWSEKGGEALAYLEKRGFDRSTVKKWEIGYAPIDGSILSHHLKSKGLLKDGISLGLVLEGQRGFYDLFRDRVIFPIRDYRGRAVGFSGRVIGSGEPKYINTRNNPIFNKGKILYGIHEAISHIRDSGRVFVVEGYFDLIRMHEVGIGNAVATCGTSLTKDHVMFLKRYANHICAVFDGDDAGYMASVRAMRSVVELGLSFSAVFLPSGEDPDSFIVKKGRDAFLRLADSSLSEPELMKKDLERRFDLSTVEGRSLALKEVSEFLSLVDDPVKREAWARELSFTLGVSESVLLMSSSGTSRGPSPSSSSSFSSPREEFLLLVCAMRFPDVVPVLSESLPYFGNKKLRDIAVRYLEEGDVPSVVEAVENKEIRDRIVRHLMFFDDVDPENVASWCRKKLKERWTKLRMKEIMDMIREAEKVGDMSKVIELMREGKQIKEEVLEG